MNPNLQAQNGFISRTDFSRTIDIPAPTPLVWSVLVNIERWPEWTASVSRVKLRSPGPLRVGSRVRIHQPRLPVASWRVTELWPGTGFTWVSRAPGLRITGRHMVETTAEGTHVALSLRYSGLLGRLVARWVGDLNEHYLSLEASGLMKCCSALAPKTNRPCSKGANSEKTV
jgi:uncharacterized membrane protein